jgi:hypothetical protein
MLMKKRIRHMSPVYNGEMPLVPLIDFVMVIQELRPKLHLNHLSLRMGLAERTLDWMQYYNRGKSKKLYFEDYLTLLALHRKFYPEGTDAYPANRVFAI